MSRARKQYQTRGESDWTESWHRGTIAAPRSDGQSVADWQGQLFDELVRRDPASTFGLGHLQDVLWEKRIALAERYCDPARLTVDVGCGNGHVARAVAERTNGRVLGIDVSRECVRFAREHNDHPLVEYRQSASAELDPGQACGLVTMYEVLEHLEDPVGELRRVGEWLCPGGHLILSTPNRSSLNRTIKRLPVIRGAYERRAHVAADAAHPGHVEEYHFDRTLSMVRSAELQVVRTFGAVLLMPFPTALRRLTDNRAFADLNVRSGDWYPRLAGELYVVARRPRV